jgi:hypothetical protein
MSVLLLLLLLLLLFTLMLVGWLVAVEIRSRRR